MFWLRSGNGNWLELYDLSQIAKNLGMNGNEWDIKAVVKEVGGEVRP